MPERFVPPPPMLLSHLVEQMGDVVWSVNAHDRSLEYLNPAAERIFGRNIEAFHANPRLWLEVVHPEDQGAVAQSHDRLMRLGKVERRYRILRPDGQVVWLHDMAWLMPDEQGQPRRLYGVARDVTDHQEAFQRGKAALVQAGEDIAMLQASQHALRASRDDLDQLLQTSPVVIFTCEPTSARIPTYISPSLERVLGYRREELLGNERWRRQVVHPKDQEETTRQVARLLDEGGSIQLRYRVRHQAGHYLWVQSEMRLLRDAEGRPEKIVGALLDITEAQSLNQRLEKLGEQLPGFVYQYQIDPDGHAWFPYASRRSLELYGATPEALRESHAPALEVVHPDDRARVTEAIRHSAETLERWHCEYRVCHPRGHELWVSGLATPERLPGGAVLWHGFIADITERKRVHLELEASERRYRRITENISDLVCLLSPNPAAILRFVSPSVTRLLGYDRDELLGRSAYDIVHPDDRERLRAWAYLEARTGEPNTGIGIEYRCGHREGHYVWLHTTTMPVRSRRGRVIALQTLSREVTERRQAEQALKRLAQRQEQILEAAGEGIYGLDEAGHISFMNRAASRMLGWRLSEVRGRLAHALFHHHHRDGSPYASAECPTMQAMRQGNSRRALDEWFWRRDGSGFAVELVASPIREGGRVSGCVVVFQDITERRQAQAELERLSTTDGLTGAPNRRHFLERLDNELHRQARHGHSAALVMFDVDYFKRINDRWGHAAGDRVLKQLVDTCQGLLRATDLLGRLGGEEFAVLLPEADVVGGGAFAERLRAAIEAMRVDHGGEVLRITLSLGVAAMRPHDTPESALERADDALYAAKRGGRNRWGCR
ncbi:PAS domain S-box protein [Halomonas cerina]|uniref:Diguanylate cyclase (GGDEF)-like protein/PAS domain S-box-containing protein n=1 Tax=Halomonas cerina TaxID=447424 RepID=A0A839V3N0_9GAMM|nr:PAS domain S-box protein [Halomonas cerina]MBB3190303.1 diguanylate cyclase (GGDEF)-like protein/PAS domain S-box-containing protein [Halomonas cerina]